MKVAILASGNLGLTVLRQLYGIYAVEFIFTDSQSTGIVSFCQENEIPLFKGNPRNSATQKFLADKSCEVMLSINYLFLIDEDIIKFPSKYIINFHGSLLPKYRGRTPHVWAIINNETKTGITAHFIDTGCDTGDIVDQIEIEILPDDTGARILDKFNQLYVPFVLNVLNKIEKDTLQPRPQKNEQATYFGKRTPTDGGIVWDWQKERINNWVRAQAAPYPGAFCYAGDKQITIDKISFVEDGFSYDQANGTVLGINPIRVKTPNGVIQLDEVRENQIDIKIGDILK